MRRILFALVIGLAGTAVLASLGNWQLARLAWKQEMLDRIEARIADAPVPLPAEPRLEADQYLPVTATGTIGDEAIRLLVSVKLAGAGYRLVSPFETGGRRIMVDRGFHRDGDPQPAPPAVPVAVTGNLHWPDETGSSTPAPDLGRNLWFARDVTAMAQALGTEPVLLVARTVSPAEQGMTLLPVDTAAIPNDHLNYAITWFSLAAVWAAMTAFFLWRSRATDRT